MTKDIDITTRGNDGWKAEPQTQFANGDWAELIKVIDVIFARIGEGSDVKINGKPLPGRRPYGVAVVNTVNRYTVVEVRSIALNADGTPVTALCEPVRVTERFLTPKLTINGTVIWDDGNRTN